MIRFTPQSDIRITVDAPWGTFKGDITATVYNGKVVSIVGVRAAGLEARPERYLDILGKSLRMFRVEVKRQQKRSK